MAKRATRNVLPYVTDFLGADWDKGAIHLRAFSSAGVEIHVHLSPDYAIPMHARIGELLAERFAPPLIDGIELARQDDTFSFALSAGKNQIGAGQVTMAVAEKTKAFLDKHLGPDNVVRLRGKRERHG